MCKLSHWAVYVINLMSFERPWLSVCPRHPQVHSALYEVYWRVVGQDRGDTVLAHALINDVHPQESVWAYTAAKRRILILLDKALCTGLHLLAVRGVQTAVAASISPWGPGTSCRCAPRDWTNATLTRVRPKLRVLTGIQRSSRTSSCTVSYFILAKLLLSR